jgi:hypothetical protein
MGDNSSRTKRAADDPEVIRSMKSPHSTTGRLAVAATVLLALGLATPAAAIAAPVTDGAKPAWDNAEPLSITPSSGGPGTSVTARAICPGTVRSNAFVQDIPLRQGTDGLWTGTGTVASSGLVPGQSYPVTLRCTNNAGTLNTTFTFTGTTPSGGASAGFGGRSDEQGGGSQATALAVGSGVAVAGAAGYAFLAKRRRPTGNHTYN